ncbi:B12-binding domain-containing radical SAM protein [Peterkaempfera sp. SMS 1(5)a]|uniref:B12-binding domain-containing radical SAM protein n=1 Tax=Peterkaempfera podocarpi TaxID=3232308 RepID=UPI00366B11CA
MPLVLLVNPPNTTQVLEDVSCTVTRPEDLTDWANVPSLGALTLASALVPVPGVTPVYLDGTIVPWKEILRFVEDHADDLLAVCVSMLTASYEAGLALLRHTKALRPGIHTIVGNDHVSALARQCLSRQRDCMDFGFVGNEVVGPFRSLIADLHRGTLRSPRAYPGMVAWSSDGLVETPQRPEPVFTGHDYRLIDEVYPHTAQYRANFASRVAPRLRELLGVPLHNGVPVELARGCIKFSRHDACTFCSIQYGGMWRNSVPDAAQGWRVVEHAVRSGYDYLSLTADELPLTFGSLLREMRDGAPDWWTGLPENERPVFGGYARADGLSSPRHAATLRELGVRYLMVGLDAGSAVSLSALNKPLAPARGGDPRYRAERMFQHNLDALERARDEGIYIKAGFVVGHIGMTRRLLEQNIESICALVDAGKGAIASSDIEVLSPEPGSFDHRYLTEPAFAAEAAQRLGLEIADADVRAGIAVRHAELDTLDREQAMDDYVRAVMPELTLDDLAKARERLREHCRSTGVFVGE